MATAKTAQVRSIPEAEDSLAVLKALAEAASVFVGMMFIAGFSYLAGFFETFGISRLELDIPVPLVAMIGLGQVTASWKPLAVAGGSVVLVAISGHWIKRRWIVVALLAGLLLGAATWEMSLGRAAANSAVQRTSAAFPNVSFASKTKHLDAPPCVEFETYGTFDCKLLAHVKGMYYFFQPVDESQVGPYMNIVVYGFPESDLLGVNLERGLNAQ